MSSNPNHASAPPSSMGFMGQNNLQVYPSPNGNELSGPPPPYSGAEMEPPKTNNSPPPQYEGPPLSACPPYPNQHYPYTNAASNQHHGYLHAPPPAPVMDISVNSTLRGTDCCGGMVMEETDVRCLIHLILLSIITFPIGLLFLCCIPCSIRRRCSVCYQELH